MSDDHTLIVTVTGDTEDVLTQLSPTPLETAAEVGATWVARWCRGASLRTSIDTLSWNAHTVQMAIRLDPTIHERLIALARERQREPVDTHTVRPVRRSRRYTSLCPLVSCGTNGHSDVKAT